MLKRQDDAEDVAQEAFARLAAASPDVIEDVRGWLVVVTRRLCLDRICHLHTFTRPSLVR